MLTRRNSIGVGGIKYIKTNTKINQTIMKFKKRKLKKRNWKLTKILLAEIAIFLAMFFILADLTFERVATALYPEVEIPTIEPKTPPEPILSVREHICAATGGENCEVLINLAKCESSLNKDAYNVNTNKTVDLGLFQINSVHYGNGNMSAVCALDVYCSARWTNEQIKKGNGHIWVCWDKI